MKQAVIGLKTLAAVLIVGWAVPAFAQDTTETRLKQLEEQIQVLTEELVSLQDSKSESPSAPSVSRTTVGGYGEIHFNDTIGTDKSYWDIHRFVLYVGHRFSDRISFHSETEIEHAWLEGGEGGEVVIEQMFVDVALRETFGLRFGRVLIPVGRINPFHEPTQFFGVERPNVDKAIIPSTWYGDGAGMYGRIGDSWQYELYLTSGLDGSGFSAIDGIRGGRQKERPGFHDPSLSGRLTFTVLGDTASGVDTRLDLSGSFFAGGVNNGNKGSIPGTDTDLTMLAFNADFFVGAAEFHGQYVTISIDDPTVIGPTIAEQMNGWYLEAGWHVIQRPADAGSLIHDLVVFARYEAYNTQADMPDGVLPDPKGDRNELTFGVSWYPAANVVLKADYQVLDDETEAGRNNQLNLGVGWRF